MANEWGYEENNGPSTWPLSFPLASGSQQSPVNVETCNVTSDDTLKNSPLTWKYEPDCCLSLTNTGHGWRVDVDGSCSELTGGPLEHRYKLEQFHCHWGSDICEGSEHTVDGKAFAGELHLVHWNSDKYACIQDAIHNQDGLAVLGVLFEVGPDDHPEIEKIVSLIPNIIFKDQKETIESPIDPAKFLPDIPCYWTYPGSLTTPPCLESVTWILFKNPIKVSEKQLNAFRSLRTGHPDSEIEKMLVQNYRPTLPLGNRVLRECGSM